MAWLTGYKYRKQFLINGTIDGAQSNYQMRLIINRSAGVDSGANVYVETKCRSDYNDIRITRPDDTPVLDYWIESSDANSATIWIEFDSIPPSPSSAICYLYYGNAGASAPNTNQNMGSATFPFFDHFDTDLSKWTGDTAKCTVASSICTLNPTDGDDAIFGITYSGQTKNRFRYKGKVTTGYRGHTGLYNSTPAGYGSYFFMRGELVDISQLYTSNNGVDTWVISNWTRDAWKIREILLNGSDYNKFYEENILVLNGNVITNEPNISLLAVIAAGTGPGGTGINEVDWLFIANFTNTEPTWSTWGAEENFLLGGLGMGGMGR